MKILFLHSSRFADAPWKDGSTRYRCYHFAEALQSLGHLAEVAPLHALNLSKLSDFDVVSVLRPQAGRKLERLLARCRQMGIRTVADVDDLIFDPALACLSPSVVNAQAAERIVRQHYQRNLDAMLGFDEISVTTEPLARAWRNIGANTHVTVLSNGLSDNWLNNPAQCHSGCTPDRQLITYLPGTHSHDHDFAKINHLLLETLSVHPRADLLIVGELDFDAGGLPSRRVTRQPWVDYEYLPGIIAASHVTLAPLVQNPFTQAKSHIKFTESAAFGTPAICSPNDDICKHSVDGLWVAGDGQDWEQALNAVLTEPEYDKSDLSRQKSSLHNSLMHYARSHCTAQLVAKKMVSRWAELPFDHDSMNGVTHAA
ncbi:MAG: hypothetical protein AB8B79_09560 [Granulosicoccus sp.]